MLKKNKGNRPAATSKHPAVPVPANISRTAAEPPKRSVNLKRRAEIGKEKRARTRKQVLEAAFSLLGHERGLTTRIEEICKAAGISRGSFYNHFDGIYELFDALSYELNHSFNVAVTAVLIKMPRAADRVDAAVRYYLDRALKDPKWAWAMVNISVGGTIFGADTYWYTQKTAEAGVASGEFKTDPNAGRDLQLGATFAAMITQLRSPSSPTFPASVARQVLLGLGVPRAKVEQIVSRPLPDPMMTLSEEALPLANRSPHPSFTTGHRRPRP